MRWGDLPANAELEQVIQPIIEPAVAPLLPSIVEPMIGNKCNDDDPRLSDARPPLAHSHAEYVATNDSRLSDARAPLAHTHTKASITDFAHTHAQSEVTGLPAVLLGKVDNTDARLSDARTPLAHNHTQAEITGLAASLNGKEPSLGNPSADGQVLSSTASGTRSWTSPAGNLTVKKKTADQNFTAIAYADVADLSFTLAANTDYAFEFLVIWSSVATTTGVGFALNGPASPTMFFAVVETATTATAMAIRQDTAYDQGAASASIDAANTNRLCRIKGSIRTGAQGGNLTVRCKTEIANSAITVKRGSWGTLF